MRVAGIQFDITWEDPAANLTRVAPWIAAAAAAGARLCVLPELFACGFSMDTARRAEVEGGPTSEFLGAQARAHNMWICGSIPERGGSDPAKAGTRWGAVPRQDEVFALVEVGEAEWVFPPAYGDGLCAVGHVLPRGESLR